MKQLFNYFSIVMLLCIGITFISCEEEVGNDTNLIAGTWIEGTTTMILDKDGSYLKYIGNEPYGSDSQYRKGSYSYDETTRMMVINVVAVPNHNGAYQNTYIVQTLSKNTLVLLYPDGDVEGFYTRK